MRFIHIFSAICQGATLSALLLSRTGIPARAAIPLAVDCRTSALTVPSAGAVVAGALEIRGRANVPDFRFYKLEFAPAGSDTWVLIGPDVIHTPITQEGRLVIWQTTIVPDGVYRLRMHVVDPSGNYCEIILQPIIVSNGQPPVSNSPSPSPLPTETETPFLGVPPQPTATTPPTIVTDVFPIGTPSSASNNRGLPLPDVNLVAFGSIFALGACGMGLVVAALYLVTRFMNRGVGS